MKNKIYFYYDKDRTYHRSINISINHWLQIYGKIDLEFQNILIKNIKFKNTWKSQD